MAGKAKEQSCCSTDNRSGCRVEAMVSVDERGQMVLPKELREKAGIRAGDKLALTSWERDGKICCISITRADDLSDMIRAALVPVLKEIL